MGFVIRFIVATARNNVLSLNPNANAMTHSIRIDKNNAVNKLIKTSNTNETHNLSFLTTNQLFDILT